jgi:hypothetical protein
VWSPCASLPPVSCSRHCPTSWGGMSPRAPRSASPPSHTPAAHSCHTQMLTRCAAPVRARSYGCLLVAASGCGAACRGAARPQPAAAGRLSALGHRAANGREPEQAGRLAKRPRSRRWDGGRGRFRQPPAAHLAGGEGPPTPSAGASCGAAAVGIGVSIVVVVVVVGDLGAELWGAGRRHAGGGVRAAGRGVARDGSAGLQAVARRGVRRRAAVARASRAALERQPAQVMRQTPAACASVHWHSSLTPPPWRRAQSSSARACVRAGCVATTSRAPVRGTLGCGESRLSTSTDARRQSVAGEGDGG